MKRLFAVASLRAHFAHAPLRWRLLIAYLVADNAYGLTLARFADHPDDPAKLEARAAVCSGRSADRHLGAGSARGR